MKINILKRAKQVLDIEAKAVSGLKKSINADFKAALRCVLDSKGRWLSLA
jgi:D-arabinose 5-phosphate isomerase GutQ